MSAMVTAEQIVRDDRAARLANPPKRERPNEGEGMIRVRNTNLGEAHGIAPGAVGLVNPRNPGVAIALKAEVLVPLDESASDAPVSRDADLDALKVAIGRERADHEATREALNASEKTVRELRAELSKSHATIAEMQQEIDGLLSASPTAALVTAAANAPIAAPVTDTTATPSGKPKRNG